MLQFLTWYFTTSLVWLCLIMLSFVDKYDKHLSQLKLHTPELFHEGGDLKRLDLGLIFAMSAILWPLSLWDLLKP